MKESTIEDYVINRVKQLGGFTRKVVYQGRTGAPDRWCFFPNGLLLIMEIKRPKKVPKGLQAQEIADLQSMGQFVYSPNTKQAVDDILRRYFP